MKRLLAPMSRIAEWEPPIPRQHLYAILMLAGFSVASVTLLPSPDELLVNNPIAVQPEDLSNDAAMSGAQTADTEFLSISDHELVGDEAFFAALKQYTLENTYKITTQVDFFRAIRAYSGADLTVPLRKYLENPPTF